MTSRLVALCFDANDPARLARFWAAALRWEAAGSTGVMPSDGTTFHIAFRPVPGEKTSKNSIHLDLTTSSIEDQSASVEQLLALGARHVDVGQGPGDRHVVLGDPEGNEFCLIEPENNFLAGRGRLGSITCDGSPQVGYFWRDALGWDLFWDQDDETAIRTPDGTGPFITWGPPVPVMTATNRLHLDVAPVEPSGQAEEVDRLVSLGAIRTDIVHDDGSAVLADPDGNEFRVLPD